MKKIKKLSIKVTYRVGLGDVEMPDDVYQQLLKADSNGHEIESDDNRYMEAAEWMCDHIRERDCFEWNADIEQLHDTLTDDNKEEVES